MLKGSYKNVYISETTYLLDLLTIFQVYVYLVYMQKMVETY